MGVSRFVITLPRDCAGRLWNKGLLCGVRHWGVWGVGGVGLSMAGYRWGFGAKAGLKCFPYSSSPPCSLLPSFPFSITPSFPFSFPSPSLSLFFLLPPATPQTCPRCSGRPCPFDDALRCWVVAQAAPFAWKDSMPSSPTCLKPCPLPMPSKPPAARRPLGSVLTCSSWSPSQARDSLCPPGKEGATQVFSYATFPTTPPGGSVLG